MNASKTKSAAAGRRARRVVGAVVLCGALAACGGRSAQPVAVVREIDVALTCEHIDAELRANTAREADLRAERVDNRLRTLSRLPGAIIGNPVTAIVLADPSIAIYRELNALDTRNGRLETLRTERTCGAEPAPAAVIAQVDDPTEVVGPAAPAALIAEAETPADETAGAPETATAEGAVGATDVIETASLGAGADQNAAADAAAEAAPAEGGERLRDAPWAQPPRAAQPPIAAASAAPSAPAATPAVAAAAPPPPVRPVTATIVAPLAEDVGPDAPDG